MATLELKNLPNEVAEELAHRASETGRTISEVATTMFLEGLELFPDIGTDCATASEVAVKLLIALVKPSSVADGPLIRFAAKSPLEGDC